MSADQNLTLHRSGSGEQIVLLHGFTGSWHIWRPVIERLEDSCEVIALTLPGHLGWPWRRDLPMSLDNVADALVERLRDLGIERPHVAGNSLGGWLSLLLAARGEVRSATAFSPAGGWSPDERTEQDRIQDLFRKMRQAIGEAMPVAADLLADPESRRALMGVVLERGDLIPVDEAVRMWEAVLAVEDLEQAFAAIDTPLTEVGPEVPASIVWCGRDQLLPQDTCSAAWREAAPYAQWSVLESAGHVPMYDDPAGVAERIRETVARATS